MAHVASVAMHRETCALHVDDGKKKCSGFFKRGGKCTHNATGHPVPPTMPTCKLHQDQLRITGWCRAQLHCGFECSRIFEWKPFGFQLCSVHRESMGPCYFLKIPTELRLRVYRYLLPDKPIPARFNNSRALKTDGERVYTEIFRVNHLIHDEVAALLYGSTAFTIEVCENNLSMCNVARPFVRYELLDPNHLDLRDFQGQLMLLEQISQESIRLARQRQENRNGELSSSRQPITREIQLPTRSSFSHEYKPSGPVWNPLISNRYFNMIRSFVIEFVFLSARGQNATGHHSQLTLNMDDSMLYDYCDNLHILIGRLLLIQRPLLRLEIIINFGGTYEGLEEALSATQLLLQPFRRLGHVAKPEVRSITMGDFRDRQIEFLVAQGVECAVDTSFRDYVKAWSSSLPSLQLSIECLQVFEAYWQLDKLVYDMMGNSHYSNPRFDKFSSLLYAAKVAREADDLASFREIWSQVVHIWFDYRTTQEAFHEQVACSINAICEIVEK